MSADRSQSKYLLATADRPQRPHTRPPIVTWGMGVSHTGKVPPNNTRTPIPTGHMSTSCGRLSIEATRTESIARGSARSTTLFQLATELPAAVLARMLGIHISVAAV
jgi:hypothetical protein